MDTAPKSINNQQSKQIADIQHNIHLNKRYKKSKNKIKKTIQTALKISYKHNMTRKHPYKNKL